MSENDIPAVNNQQGGQQGDPQGEASILGIVKFAFRGTYAIKAIFIAVISILYFNHICGVLKVGFLYTSLAFSLCVMFFIILWKFGCDKESRFSLF